MKWTVILIGIQRIPVSQFRICMLKAPTMRWNSKKSQSNTSQSESDAETRAKKPKKRKRSGEKRKASKKRKVKEGELIQLVSICTIIHRHCRAKSKILLKGEAHKEKESGQ